MNRHFSDLGEIERLLGEARERVRKLSGTSAPARQAALSLREVIRRRRLREELFAPELFGDPAWDILLELTVSYLEGKAVPVSSACAAAGVPPTTALRWINTLVEHGLAERNPDPTDRRRVYLRLSERGWEGMRSYLERAGIPAES